MPLPPDAALDERIGEMYDLVMHNAVQPGQFGIVAANAARLQAISQRRLVVALQKATEPQDLTNQRIVRLECIGIALAVVGATLALVQAIPAILSFLKWIGALTA